MAQVRALQGRGARDRARARVGTGGHSRPSLGDGRGLPDRVPRGGLAARRAQKAELSAISLDEAVLCHRLACWSSSYCGHQTWSVGIATVTITSFFPSRTSSIMFIDL